MGRSVGCCGGEAELSAVGSNIESAKPLEGETILRQAAR